MAELCPGQDAGKISGKGTKMWYVIWTASRYEERMAERIKTEAPPDSYKRCWIPRRTERRRVHGELMDVERVLFPGYILIETEAPEAVQDALRSMKDFFGVLRTGDYFTPLSLSEEQLIRKLTGENGIAGISIGVIEDGKVRVVDGPLVGFEKYIVAVDKHKRTAFLEMELLGEKRRIHVGLEVVDKSEAERRTGKTDRAE